MKDKPTITFCPKNGEFQAAWDAKKRVLHFQLEEARSGQIFTIPTVNRNAAIISGMPCKSAHQAIDLCAGMGLIIATNPAMQEALERENEE
jgi:hypothetical protein